jgi:gamma-glutamyltranspeptidase/glutathione hydrolase
VETDEVPATMRDFQLPGRSPVRVTEAAAATSHPLASMTAIEILKDGGNAIDAAVAAAAVLAVVEPQSTGIGGDAFMLYAPRGGEKVVAFNGSGRAPRYADIEWFRHNGVSDISAQSPHSVTIPGVVDAWARIVADHGTRELGALLQSAIRYAEEGYIVHDRVAFDWHASATMLALDPDAANIFLPGDRVPQAGDRHRQPALAATLRRIAEQGRDGFYSGTVAQDIVDHLRNHGGLHTLEDFAGAQGEYVDSIFATYRGVDIHQIPPNNQGITALIMLNLLSGFDTPESGPLSGERLHLEIETGRLAYDLRNRFIADPKYAEVNGTELLSPLYADRLRRCIDVRRAANVLLPQPLKKSETVYLCVVDRDQNVVSFINSIYHSFGCGLVSPKSGVLLQNRGMSFTLDPTHPNCIAPGKRPLHTIMPGLAMRNGRALMAFGVMGGDYQPFGHTHVLTNILDFHMDPQAAIDCPRVFYNGGIVEAERGIGAAARTRLASFGHRVETPPEPLGGGQAIMIDWEKGTLTAGSDPRKDGCALGY